MRGLPNLSLSVFFFFLSTIPTFPPPFPPFFLSSCECKRMWLNFNSSECSFPANMCVCVSSFLFIHKKEKQLTFLLWLPPCLFGMLGGERWLNPKRKFWGTFSIASGLRTRFGLALRVYILGNSGGGKGDILGLSSCSFSLLRSGFGGWMEAVDTTPSPPPPLYFPLSIFLGLYLALCDYHSPLTKNDQLLVLFLVHLFSFWKGDQSKN